MPNCPWRCPVANYLRSIFPTADFAIDTTDLWWGLEEYRLPKAITAFITAFDKQKKKK